MQVSGTKTRAGKTTAKPGASRIVPTPSSVTDMAEETIHAAHNSTRIVRNSEVPHEVVEIAREKNEGNMASNSNNDNSGAEELPVSRRTRPGRRSRSVSCSSDNTRGEPYSPQLATKQVAHLIGNRSKSLPCSPGDLVKDFTAPTKMSKNVKNELDDAASSGVGQGNNSENITKSKVDINSSSTFQSQVGQDKTLACIRTRPIKKKKSVGYKHQGAHSEPNSPLFATRHKQERNEDEVSKSLPGSPIDNDNKRVIQKTMKDIVDIVDERKEVVHSTQKQEVEIMQPDTTRQRCNDDVVIQKLV